MTKWIYEKNAGLLKLKPHEEMPFLERKKFDGKHVPAKGWNSEQSSWLREAVKEGEVQAWYCQILQPELHLLLLNHCARPAVYLYILIRALLSLLQAEQCQQCLLQTEQPQFPQRLFSSPCIVVALCWILSCVSMSPVLESSELDCDSRYFSLWPLRLLLAIASCRHDVSFLPVPLSYVDVPIYVRNGLWIAYNFARWPNHQEAFTGSKCVLFIPLGTE